MFTFRAVPNIARKLLKKSLTMVTDSVAVMAKVAHTIVISDIHTPGEIGSDVLSII